MVDNSVSFARTNFGFDYISNENLVLNHGHPFFRQADIDNATEMRRAAAEFNSFTEFPNAVLPAPIKQGITVVDFTRLTRMTFFN